MSLLSEQSAYAVLQPQHALHFQSPRIIPSTLDPPHEVLR
jgi:hypothetical protein